MIDRHRDHAIKRIMLTRAWRAHGRGVTIVFEQADGLRFLESE